MFNILLNKIRLVLARRDLQLAIYEEKKLRQSSQAHSNAAWDESYEADRYRKEVIPAREDALKSAELEVLADKFGRW